MSLGLTREKCGDILLQEDRAQIVVAKEVVSYIEMNLQSIGKVKVSLSPVQGKNSTDTRNVGRNPNGFFTSFRCYVS